MDFDLTDFQSQLRDSVRALLDRTCPPSTVREVCERRTHGESTKELWERMVHLDWPALTVPAQFGGIGVGFIDLAMVLEELGRTLAPSPFVSTTTQFLPAIREAGSDSQQKRFLEPIARSGSTGTLALFEEGATFNPADVSARARRVGDGWVINGRKDLVFDGETADEIAVIARGEGCAELGIFVVPGQAIKAVAKEVIDRTQPLAQIYLDDVWVPFERVLVEPGERRAAYAIKRSVEEATAALALSLTGTCRTIFEMTLRHAEERVQFGRPIGSFQAVKHRLVDMFLALERASSLAWFAALAIAEEDPRRSVAVAMAKAAAGECQRLVVQEGLQLHGALGFTWEHDLHLFLKRAKSAELLFGSARTHRLALARELGLLPARASTSDANHGGPFITAGTSSP